MAIIRKPRHRFNLSKGGARVRAAEARLRMHQMDMARPKPDPVGQFARTLGVAEKIGALAVPVLDTLVAGGGKLWDALDGDEQEERRKAAEARAVEQKKATPAAVTAQKKATPAAVTAVIPTPANPSSAVVPPNITPEEEAAERQEQGQTNAALFAASKAKTDTERLGILKNIKGPEAELFRARIHLRTEGKEDEGAAALVRLRDSSVGAEAVKMFNALPPPLQDRGLFNAEGLPSPSPALTPPSPSPALTPTIGLPPPPGGPPAANTTPQPTLPLTPEEDTEAEKGFGIQQIEDIPIVVAPKGDPEFKRAWDAMMRDATALHGGKEDVDMGAITAFFANEVYQRKAVAMGMTQKNLREFHQSLKELRKPLPTVDSLVRKAIGDQEAAGTRAASKRTYEDPKTLNDVYNQLAVTRDPQRQAELLSLIESGGVSGVTPRTLRELITGAWTDRALSDGRKLIKPPKQAKPLTMVDYSRIRDFASKERGRQAAARDRNAKTISDISRSLQDNISKQYGDIDRAGRVYNNLNLTLARAAKLMRKGRGRGGGGRRPGNLLWSMRQLETNRERRSNTAKSKFDSATAALDGNLSEASIAMLTAARDQAKAVPGATKGVSTYRLRTAEAGLRRLYEVLGMKLPSQGKPIDVTLPPGIPKGKSNEVLKRVGIFQKGGFASEEDTTVSAGKVVRNQQRRVSRLRDEYDKALRAQETTQEGRAAIEYRRAEERLRKAASGRKEALAIIETYGNQVTANSQEQEAIIHAIGIPCMGAEEWNAAREHFTGASIPIAEALRAKHCNKK